MKRLYVFFLSVLPVLASCDMLGDGKVSDEGELDVSFGDALQDDTRAPVEIPDTNDFLLYVSDSKGNAVYEGTYGDAPESIMVKAGSYNVRVLSSAFSKPGFSKPLFGDEQCVLVEEGKTASVKLLCTQLNSGIRLKISPAFLTSYPSSSLVLKSQNGSLMYGYSEKRIAYFLPGNVSLVMSQGGTDRALMTRWLEPGEILSLGIEVSESSQDSGGSARKEISVAVDTSRIWIDDTFVIGDESGKGQSSETAMGITQAMASVGQEGVWVAGYIIGGDLTSSSMSLEEPFSSRTNVALGPKPGTVNRSSCLSVQLPSGAVRDNLNLVDNPEVLGRRVCLKGNVVASYYGLVGIKNVTDYVLE